MSRYLFILLLVVVASATLVLAANADKEIEDKGTGYYRCTVLEDPAGVYYYNEKVFDTCVELKVD